MLLFARRLKCFYCGRRSAQSGNGPIRKWHCKHCEAVNHLDEKGETTDPPVAETNPDANSLDPSSPFESIDVGLSGAGLFCGRCIRNQHLFTSALAAYFPPSDDPNDSAYEQGYPEFRRNLEERYPQVCEKCEPRVKERIRQAGYTAKADHLRRMMERSRAGRAARRARRWNWRSLLVSAGATGYWASVAGQLAWSLMCALTVGESLQDADSRSRFRFLASCIRQIYQARFVPGNCAFDLTPYAGLSLVAGILALWWNPMLRAKIDGKGGRLRRLGEYYQFQLIVMVVRCAFWAVLRDPSSSGLDPALPSALHLFMFAFTILSVFISRRIVRLDNRLLINWSETTPTATPMRNTEAPDVYIPQSESGKRALFYPYNRTEQITRVPIEKPATPRPAHEQRAIPTPPPEVDDMDWTPSAPQYNLRVTPRDQKSVLDGPTPFYGALPPAPQPPAWKLRAPPARPKPVSEAPNPFHHNHGQSASSWTPRKQPSDVVFAPPKFFPEADHASTGLENLFDRAFTIRSPEDGDDAFQSSQKAGSSAQAQHAPDLRGPALVFQCIRFGLLLISLLAWNLSQFGIVAIPGNYIEVVSLGSASLLSGFALLEVLKRPIGQWNGMEILVYFAELVAAVHLGGYLPEVSFERRYFDRYGKLLLIFMAVQEALALLAVYRAASSPDTSSTPEEQLHGPLSPDGSTVRGSPESRVSKLSEYHSLASPSSSTAPPGLSFSSTAAGSSFYTQGSHQPQLAYSPYGDTLQQNHHRFSMNSLASNDLYYASDVDRDSDTETTMTTATTATDNTIRNIRYGFTGNNAGGPFSPRGAELGPGIGGLSLDDTPVKRVTRSQTRRGRQTATTGKGRKTQRAVR